MADVIFITAVDVKIHVVSSLEACFRTAEPEAIVGHTIQATVPRNQWSEGAVSGIR